MHNTYELLFFLNFFLKKFALQITFIYDNKILCYYRQPEKPMLKAYTGWKELELL